MSKLGPSDPRHGKVSTYVNHACRCERCTAANREAMKRYRDKLSSRPYDASDHRHGTISGYKYLACKCERCIEAYRSQRRRLKHSLQPGDHRHGTINGYVNYSCRCYKCRQAQARYYELRKSQDIAS